MALATIAAGVAISRQVMQACGSVATTAQGIAKLKTRLGELSVESNVAALVNSKHQPDAGDSIKKEVVNRLLDDQRNMQKQIFDLKDDIKRLSTASTNQMQATALRKRLSIDCLTISATCKSKSSISRTISKLISRSITITTLWRWMSR
jgi:TolA-binding protein